mgnify:CR=1 FL=1
MGAAFMHKKSLELNDLFMSLYDVDQEIERMQNPEQQHKQTQNSIMTDLYIVDLHM